MSEGGVACPQCGQVCKNERGLKKHQSSKHNKNDASAANDSKEIKTSVKEPVTTDATEIVCPQCGQVYKSEHGLKIHQGKQHNNALPNNNSESKSNVKETVNFQKKTSISNTKTAFDNPHKDGLFSSDVSKQTHQVRRADEAKYNSTAPNKKTNKNYDSDKVDNQARLCTSKERNSNDDEVDSNSQTFMCPICKKSLPTLRGFRIHTAKMHPHCFSENFSSEDEDSNEDGNERKDESLSTSVNNKDKIKPDLTEWRNMGNEISHDIYILYFVL